MRRRLALVLPGLLAAVVLRPAVAAPPPRSLPARPALAALHATRGADAGIFDALGRQVLMRGTNLNQLGDYYQDDKSLAPVEPLTEGDFVQIASLGFNAVRLIVSWSSLEPRRGFIDPAYLTRIHQAVAWAGAHGVYVVLDMHQDAWGKYIATPPGTSCPAPLSRAIGWDGAPAWATITDGLTTCRLDIRELSPAVAEAWQNFYLDRDGIQSELVRSWGALAASFANNPTVAGYDLLNEPNPGLAAVGPSDLVSLGSFYQRALAAIRVGEGRARGGFHHIAFVEPMATWSALSAGVSPGLTFPSDSDVVYAPHLYAGSLTLDNDVASRPVIPVSFGFQEAQREAALYGAAWWTGEWGWFGDPVAEAPLVAQFVQLEDQYLVGGAWWDWKQACGDPHQIGSPGAPPGAIADGLNRYSCPSGRSLGQPPQFVSLLSRAYPRAAPGRLTSLQSDPASGRMRLGGVAARAGVVSLWIPHGGSPTAPIVSGGPVALAAVPGGWLASVTVGPGPYEVGVDRR